MAAMPSTRVFVDLELLALGFEPMWFFGHPAATLCKSAASGSQLRVAGLGGMRGVVS